MGRWARTLVVVGATAYLGTWLVNRSLVAVEGASMEPTLVAGDRLLTIPACRATLRAGQVVVVAEPTTRDHLVVKRLTTVERGRVIVLGDHQQASTDSRAWGWLPRRAVRRRVLRRWPDLRTRLDR